MGKGPTIETVITGIQVSERIDELAEQVADDYTGRNLLLVGLLNGGANTTIALGDALFALGMNVPADYMRVESYGQGMESNGSPRITADTKNSVAGYDVLLVDDIRHTGLSLAAVLGLLETKGANSAEAFVLTEIEGAAQVDVNPKYVGFTLQDGYYVGEGLDAAELYRFFPGIGVVRED